MSIGLKGKALGFQNINTYWAHSCLLILYEVMSLKVVRKYFMNTYKNEFLEVFKKSSWRN